MPGMSLTTLGLGLGMFGGAGAGGFVPNQISGLQLWLDASIGTYQDGAGAIPATADNDPVGLWQDQSGNEHHATQATAASRPSLKLNVAGNEPALRFNVDFLQAAFGKDFAQPNTVIIVVRRNESGALDIYSDGVESTKRHSLHFLQSDILRMYAGASLDSAETYPETTPYITIGVFNGSSSRLIVNGGDVAAFGNTGSHALSGMTLGARYDGSQAFTFDIFEVLVYDRELSDAEINQVGGYLGGRYEGADWTDVNFLDGGGLETQSIPGAWTWFSSPRAVAYNGNLYFGSVGNHGDILITKYNYATGVLGPLTVLKSPAAEDDHNNPSILIRDSDKRILVFQTGHGGAGMWMFTSNEAESVNSFDDGVKLDDQIGLDGYTYANPVQLLGEEDSPIYLFFRGDNWRHYYTKSTDEGDSWSAAQEVFLGQRPYNRLVQNGDSRIDFAINNGHPNVGETNLYHCYYEGGSWYQSDGTLITSSPPFAPSSGTTIYDAAANSNVRSWVWDIAINGSGNPVVVYATFPDTETDHRYNYAVWNGSAWSSNEISPANGGRLYSAEDYYSAGVVLDRTDPSVVYLSKRVDGVYQVFRYITSDDGSTWSSQQLTSEDEDCLRPVVAWNYPGNPKLLYFTGKYGSFTGYHTRVILRDG